MRMRGGGSTDVSDVSWVVPTVGLSTATFVPGSPGHSWQNTAAAGSSVGIKGAMLAAKTLALTTADIFRTPDVIGAAKAELANAARAGLQISRADRRPRAAARLSQPRRGK